MGYLELPQVEVPNNKLKQEMLNTKSVFILDCYTDLFVWVGKKSTRLVRAAALKLSSELFAMLIRSVGKMRMLRILRAIGQMILWYCVN